MTRKDIEIRVPDYVAERIKQYGLDANQIYAIPSAYNEYVWMFYNPQAKLFEVCTYGDEEILHYISRIHDKKIQLNQLVKRLNLFMSVEEPKNACIKIGNHVFFSEVTVDSLILIAAIN